MRIMASRFIYRVDFISLGGESRYGAYARLARFLYKIHFGCDV
jgi:hypothetical protein